MAHLIPRGAIYELLYSYVGETWRLMLLNENHVPNAGQQFLASVIANEIVDTGGKYPPGGITIGQKYIQQHGNNYYLDFADIVIGPGANLNYRWGVLYKLQGFPATCPIRAQIDFKNNIVVTNGTSTIQWNALGIIYISQKV